MKVTTESGPVVYSLQDNPAHFELSEDQFADGSQKIIYTGGLNESQVVVLIAVVSAVKRNRKWSDKVIVIAPAVQATGDGSTYPIRSTSTTISVEMVFGNTTTLPGVPTFDQPSYLKNLTLDHEEISGNEF